MGKLNLATASVRTLAALVRSGGLKLDQIPQGRRTAVGNLAAGPLNALDKEEMPEHDRILTPPEPAKKETKKSASKK